MQDVNNKEINFSKKILLLIPQNVIPSIDGGKHSIYYPMKYLAENFQVKVVVFVGNHEEKNTLSYKNINVDALFIKTDKSDKLLKIFGNIFRKLPFKFDRYYSNYNKSFILNLCKDWSPDIVICHHAHLACYGKVISKKFPLIKLFLREHNIEFLIIKQYAESRKNIIIKLAAYWQYFKAKNIEIKSWKWFDKVLFISNSDLAIAKKLKNSSNFYFIPDGSNLIPIKNVEKQNAFLFAGTLSTLQNAYNLEYFISNIWKPWKRNYEKNSFELWISGNSKQEVLKKLHLTEIELQEYNIIVLGFVDDIQKIIQTAKYFLSPTMIGAGIRLKVLEAMCNGAVIFLTRIDREMLKIFNEENIVEYNSLEEFNEQFLKLNNSIELYSIISKKAYELAVKELTWKTFNKKYLEILINE